MNTRVVLRAGPWVAALAVLVAAAVRCCGGDVRELAASLQDDSFYYLLSAFRAWQHGGVLTFDGEHAMFGVQPAYSALLVALAGPCADRETFLRVALLSSYVLYVATAFVLARGMRRLAGSEAVGALTAVVWLLNLPVLYGSTTLKENVLYGLLLAMTLVLVVDRERVRPWRTGVLLGLGLAARLTPSSLLVACVLLVIAMRRRLATGLRIVVGTLLGLLPFAVYGLAIVGRVLPTSGSVKTMPLRAALADGSYWQQLPHYLAEVPGYLCSCLAYSLGLPHDLHVPQSPPPPCQAGYVIAALVVLGVVAALRDPGLRPFLRRIAGLLSVACIGTGTTLLLLRPYGDVRYFQWYVAALPVLLVLPAGLAAGLVPVRAAAAGVWLLALVASAQAVGWIATTPPFHADEHSWSRQMLVTTARMNELLPHGARVGAANSGALGYFARDDIEVINLDGLANDDWFEAARAGTTITTYLDRTRIDYVCDVPTAAAFGRHLLAVLEPIEVTPYHGPDYEGYFLARRASVPFPELWPLQGPNSKPAANVVCVPWCDGDPLGGEREGSPVRALPSARRGVWASLRIAGSTLGSGPLFLPGGVMSELRAHVGGRDGQLVVRGDGDEELLRTETAARTWREIVLDVRDVARLEVEFVPAAVEGPALWFAGMQWRPRHAESPIRGAGSATRVFGHGCSHDGGAVPELAARCTPDTVRFVVSAPAGSAGLLVVARAPRPTRLSPLAVREPCMSWLDGEQIVATMPFVVGVDGQATVTLSLSPELAHGHCFAQALLGQDTANAGLTNGLLLQRAP